MKKPLKPKKYLTLLNIPIFGTCLWLIFFHNKGLLQSLTSLSLMLSLVAAIYFFLFNQNQKTTKAVSKKQKIISILSITLLPIVIFIFLYTPSHFVAAIHPEYLAYLPQINHDIINTTIISLLLTVILAQIISYFYYQTEETGWIYNTIVKYFKLSPTSQTVLEVYLSMPVQMGLIVYLSILVLSWSFALSHLFNFTPLSGTNTYFLFLSALFILFPRVLWHEKTIFKLEQLGMTTGYFYLVATLLALVTWTLISFLLNQLPPENLQSLQAGNTLDVKALPIPTIWSLFITLSGIAISPLLASALVRLQKNQYQHLNLIFSLVIVILLYCLLQQSYSGLDFGLFINGICLALMTAFMFMTCLFMKGNHFNLLGFLFNKNQIKTRKPVKYLIPSIQSIFSLTVLYLFGGIYILFFAIGLATMPALILILATILLYPWYRWRLKNDSTKQ